MLFFYFAVFGVFVSLIGYATLLLILILPFLAMYVYIKNKKIFSKKENK